MMMVSISQQIEMQNNKDPQNQIVQESYQFVE